MGVMRCVGSVRLVHGEVKEVMRYMGSVRLVYGEVVESSLVYGEMDVSNGLVRIPRKVKIMMWQHGKIEERERERERERESGMCHPHVQVGPWF